MLSVHSFFHEASPPKKVGASVLRNWMLAGLAGLISLGPGCGKQDAASGGAGEMPPTQVVAVEARIESVEESLSLVGSVAANEMVEIKPEIEGIVESISFEEGQRLSKGDLMVLLDDGKLSAEVAEGEANFNVRESDFIRSEELYAEKLISKSAYDGIVSRYQATEASLRLLKRRLQDTRIKAPFDGVAGSRQISPGQVVGKSDTLTWLVDLDPVKVEFNVPERFISQLELGQTLELNVAAFPDESFQGTVYFISPYVNETTRTALLKARASNPDGRLKPGMFAQLDLTLTIRENSVVIPEAAVNKILNDGKAMLYLVNDDRQVEVREVKTGVRLPGKLEILEGLKEGELVIVEGLQKIYPGAPVTLAPEEAGRPYLNRQSP